MGPIHFIAAPKPVARRIATELIDRHGQADLEQASYVVAIGGDGTTLNALNSVLAIPQVPVFSTRTPGSVGALGNTLAREDLPRRVAASRGVAVRPLRFEARTGDDKIVRGVAINEVAIVRRRFQAARLDLRVGSDEVDLFGDGFGGVTREHDRAGADVALASGAERDRIDLSQMAGARRQYRGSHRPQNILRGAQS